MGIILLFTACMSPSSKEKYIDGFGKFVERVEKHHKDYNRKDWKWADETFEKYSKVWYNKYRDELDTEERLKVIELKVKYSSLKGTGFLREMYENLLKDDVDEAKKKIDEYIENDLDEDIDKVLEGAKEIGDSAVKVLEDVIDEIERKF